LIGFFAELGPFRIQPNLTLTANPYSWNRVANMLFIDHPIGTGMSYAVSNNSFSENQEQISAHLYTVLQHFYKKHPEYKKNELYLSGESYAGKYMPSLAERIIKMKEKGENDINLKGLALGDAFIAPMIQRLIKPEQAYWNGLMGHAQLDQIKAIETKCIRHIQSGYTNQLDSACEDLKSYMLLAAGIVNVYDVRKFVPSTNKTLIDLYLNQNEVKDALHVPSVWSKFKKKYSTNAKNDVYVHLKFDILRSVKHLIPFLTKHVRILLYNGNFDLQDGPVGTEQYLFSLDIPGLKHAPRNLWFLDQKIAGYEWSTHNITFLTVHGAGHFVPTDRPATGLEMIRRFLYREPYCKKGEVVPLSFTTLTPDDYREYLSIDEKGEHRVPCAITDVLCTKLMKNCNGNGHCEGGTCVCDKGFTGEDCSNRLYDSLQSGQKIEGDLLLQQDWVYYKLDKPSSELDYLLVEMNVGNASSIPVLQKPNVKADPYFIGEGYGGNQPFGAVCVYVKKGNLPSWISFDSVQCFRDINTTSSMIAPISKSTFESQEFNYIGIFNAQPYQVKYSLNYHFLSGAEIVKWSTSTATTATHDEL
jgi:hypothetical protein